MAEPQESRPLPRDEEEGLPKDSMTTLSNHSEPLGNANEKPAAAPAGPGPVPNGGTQAWLQVLGSWVIFLNTWGTLNTFGVFQTYYESGQLFEASSSDISWIGTIQAVMLLLVGMLVGPIYDRGHFRILLAVGTVLCAFGYMMLSLCHTFWQCVLAQGIVLGIGAGCLFVPGVAIMPTYFSTRIGLALGLAASGSSTGGIIYPIMFYKLIPEVGFPWAVRILGFTVFATQLIPVTVMKMRIKPAKARSLIDVAAFSDAPYMLFVLGTTIGFIGLYIGLFYISYFGEATGITDTSLSFYLVPILNAGSVFGRTLPNLLSDTVGPTNVILPGAFCVGIILFCLIAVTSAAGLIVITVLFGFFSGIFIALPPVLYVAFTKDKSKIGTRIGMGFAIASAGVLCGGPAAGAILGSDDANLDWTGTWAYGGTAFMVCGVIYAIVRTLRVGFKLHVKV